MSVEVLVPHCAFREVLVYQSEKLLSQFCFDFHVVGWVEPIDLFVSWFLLLSCFLLRFVIEFGLISALLECSFVDVFVLVKYFLA